jgi:hypothetical protein
MICEPSMAGCAYSVIMDRENALLDALWDTSGGEFGRSWIIRADAAGFLPDFPFDDTSQMSVDFGGDIVCTVPASRSTPVWRRQVTTPGDGVWRYVAAPAPALPHRFALIVELDDGESFEGLAIGVASHDEAVAIASSISHRHLAAAVVADLDSGSLTPLSLR